MAAAPRKKYNGAHDSALVMTGAEPIQHPKSSDRVCHNPVASAFIETKLACLPTYAPGHRDIDVSASVVAPRTQRSITGDT